MKCPNCGNENVMLDFDGDIEWDNDDCAYSSLFMSCSKCGKYYIINEAYKCIERIFEECDANGDVIEK